MEKKTVYEVSRFGKTYTKGMRVKEDLYNYDFGSDGGKLLLATESEEEARAYFDKIKVEAKNLKSGEEFNFYFLDKVTYDEDGEAVDYQDIEFKQDTIWEFKLTSEQHERLVKIAKRINEDVDEVISDISCMADRYTSIDEIIDDYEKTYVKQKESKKMQSKAFYNMSESEIVDNIKDFLKCNIDLTPFKTLDNFNSLLVQAVLKLQKE